MLKADSHSPINAPKTYRQKSEQRRLKKRCRHTIKAARAATVPMKQECVRFVEYNPRKALGPGSRGGREYVNRLIQVLATSVPGRRPMMRQNPLYRPISLNKTAAQLNAALGETGLGEDDEAQQYLTQLAQERGITGPSGDPDPGRMLAHLRHIDQRKYSRRRTPADMQNPIQRADSKWHRTIC